MSQVHLKRTPGKPRRSRSLAQITTVRVDPETRAGLETYFGSMGNALVYLYRGIEELKEKHGLPSDESLKDNERLHKHDLENIFLALRWYAKDPSHHHLHRHALNRLADRILKITFLGEYFGDPEDCDE